MSIVKAADRDRVTPLFPASPVYRAVVDDARRVREEAADVLSSAKSEAAALLEEARAQADDVQSKAKSAARAEGAAEMSTLLEAFQAALQEVERDLGERVQRLAVAFARRATGIELSIRPDAFAAFVSSVRESARRYDEIRVHCHPDQTPFLSSLNADVKPDADVPAWSVRVETELGSFVASIEGAFDRLERTILEEPS